MIGITGGSQHLAASLAAIRRRHEVLRTNFQAVAGKPVIAIAPFSPGFLPLVDLTPLPAAVREREAGAVGGAGRALDRARRSLPRPILREPNVQALVLKERGHMVDCLLKEP